MKIGIEVAARDTRPAAHQVIWADGPKALGSLAASQARDLHKQVDALLAAQADKSTDLESDLFRDANNILIVSQLPKRKGLDREERIRIAAMTAVESARARGVKRLTLNL